MKKKQTKAKEPITIRFKELKGGNKSIYLDTYRDGKRVYEFLKLYLVPATNAEARTQNQNTLQAANAIKAQRMAALVNGEAGIKDKSLLKIKVSELVSLFGDRANKAGRTYGTGIRQAANLLEEYKPNATLANVDKAFCIGFIDFLQNTHKKRIKQGDGFVCLPLSGYTVANMVRLLNCALNMAVRDGMVLYNPMSQLAYSERPKVPSSQRQFLSVDEIKALMATPCKRDDVKQAFLFSCFCGLRISDIRRLKWGDIVCNDGQMAANIKMKKTKEPIYLPLSAEACKWLPSRGDAADGDSVFSSLPVVAAIGKNINDWVADAGITKHVTFHVARHTFATMMITLGADLYTTSKLLGHTDVKTTQIYAKMVDAKKVEAVNLVDSVF